MTMLIVLPVLLLMFTGKVDFGSPSNLWRVRALFAFSYAVLLGCLLYLYLRIKRRNDQRLVFVPAGAVIAFTKPVPPMGAPAAAESATPAPASNAEGETGLTVCEHDTQALMAFAKDLGPSLLFMGGIHLYLGAVPPLLFQALLKPHAFFTSSLFKIHFLGRSDQEDNAERPWLPPKSEGIFAKLFGGSQEEAPAATPSSSTAVASTSSSSSKVAKPKAE